MLMIVGLKENLPFVVKACPETEINGELVSREIWDVVGNLAKAGFNVRGICMDNHSANVSAYKKLLESYSSPVNQLAIQHPCNKSHTFVFYDNVHLLKNIRNNLLAAKSFSFPDFDFEICGKIIQSSGGSISWRELHELFEADSQLQAHLRKAHKLSYSVLHPGNKKQDVSFFHETTVAALRSFFPNKLNMSNFLELVSHWWLITNSKSRFNSSNKIGNAVVPEGDKTNFFRLLADHFENWGISVPKFCLTTHTCSALVRTLRAQADLIDELIEKDMYDFVMVGRLQSDPLERRFSHYRQMSGGRFIVSLREVISSEKILKCRALLKNEIDIDADVL